MAIILRSIYLTWWFDISIWRVCVGPVAIQVNHVQLIIQFKALLVRLRNLVGGALDHRSLPPEFESINITFLH